MSTAIVKLRAYQRAQVDQIYGHWREGSRNVLNVLPTGGGKTVEMAAIASEIVVPGVAIAHRKELINQISRAMASFGVRHNIIAADTTVKSCISRHVEMFGRSFYDPRATFTVSSVDTLSAREDKLKQWANTIGLWMVDECFLAGTLVDGTPIEQIKVGDLVTAFDEVTGQFRKKPVVRLFKKPAPPLVLRITEVSSETPIYVTQKHPFWTRRGWVDAQDLRFTDYLNVSGQWRKVTSSRLVWSDLPGSGGDGHVYNIEVADLHTYTANGVVVHNCHHVLSDNKWGRAVIMFPNGFGVGFTATPVRADRRSLARVQKGVFDAMVVGPTMRELITAGNLCEYRIFAPPASIDRAQIKISANGEFSHDSMVKVVHESKIVGDIVESYLRFAKGKRGITFVTDVEQAVEVAGAFRAAGVRAEAVSAKTPDSVREALMRKFETGALDQLVNVDLFGEGLDVPAVEVVSMGRPTESYGLFVQQFGRALRILEGKSHGIIIDHVSNVIRHGLPDAKRTWSLLADQRGKRTARDPEVMPVTTCPECFKAYEAVTPACPYCGYKPEPSGRSRPEQVDGDLIELDPAALAVMRGEVDRIDGTPLIPYGVSDIVAGAIRRNWLERQDAQTELRKRIADWAGVWKHRGSEDSEIYRRFYHTFGIDVMSAQSLNQTKAKELSDAISPRTSDAPDPRQN